MSARSALYSEKKSPEGRWRAFTYDELIARDKASLDLFWLKAESLEDSSKLPDPHILAEEIAEDLRSALEQIESVLGDLQARAKVVAKKERKASKRCTDRVLTKTPAVVSLAATTRPAR